ncbi:MAG: DUF502 domain-containing protein [Bacillota bacterium]
MLRRFRNWFIAGVAVLAPIGITFSILRFLFRFLDGILGPYISGYLPYNIPGLGALISVLLVVVAGALASNFLGRQVIRWTDLLLSRTPVVKGIYQTMRQIVDAIFASNQTAFKQVVMIEYPRRGMWSLAFVTGRAGGEVQEKTEQEVYNVFLPTTPNPTSGYLLLLPKDDIIFLDMSVEDGLKMVISGGVLTPPSRMEGAAP